MVSISLIQRTGDQKFVGTCARAGVDGLIVPDLPLEESERLRSLARDAGLTMSLLVAPTTPPARAAAIAGASTGFVYLLARAGITGESRALDTANLHERVAAIRSASPLPVACGFGVSTPEHVREVLRHADAAIVGSALVRRLSEAFASGADPVNAAGSFVTELAGAASHQAR
jgi:tryptophan synthase alpha chain